MIIVVKICRLYIVINYLMYFPQQSYKMGITFVHFTDGEVRETGKLDNLAKVIPLVSGKTWMWM